MIQQLLWLHLMLYGGLAALLLVMPGLTIRALGLPVTETGFWPRTAGALMAGFALATLAVGMNWTTTGIGLGGFIAIDASLAFVLLAMLVNGPAIPTRRGRAFLWALVLVLVALALVSIAYAR